MKSTVAVAPRIDAHHLPPCSQVLALREDLVGAGWNAVDREHPLLVGQREVARADDEDHRAVDGTAVFFQCHRAVDGSRLLR